MKKRYLYAIICIGFIVLTIKMSGQNEKLAKRADTFELLNVLYEEGNYKEALRIGETLLHEQTSSRVAYIIGISAAMEQDVIAAVTYLQMAIEHNPHYVKDATFMLQYAEILLMAERWTLASEVLVRCQSLVHESNQAQFEARIEQLMRYVQEVQL